MEGWVDEKMERQIGGEREGWGGIGGQMEEGRDGWEGGGMGGWTEEQRDGWTDGRMDRGTGTDGKEPPAPLPHLDVVIELPEAFVGQDIVYRLLGHLLQPCSTNSPGAPHQHPTDQAPPSAPGPPPGSGLGGHQLHPNPARPIWAAV